MERQIQLYREENITPDVLVGKITGYCMGVQYNTISIQYQPDK